MLGIMLGTTLGGRYKIINSLGSGGFGATFIAQDCHLPGAAPCVVKQLKPQSTDPHTLQIARRLFDTEAQSLHELGGHDRIPKLFAYFEENQEFYLVQEYIEGHDLSHELTPGEKLDEKATLDLLRELLGIIQFVQSKNVIHRDINPRNILRRNSDKKLVLIDFGAVKQITTELLNPNGKPGFSVCIGTPGYLPSEQANGFPKPSSDIYAVGIVALQALSGLLPHEFPKDPETEEIKVAQLVEVSPEFIKVLERMVRYDFRERYGSATEALAAIADLEKPTVMTVSVPGVASLPPPRFKFSKPQWVFGVISCGIIGAGMIAGSVFVWNKIKSVNASELYHQGHTLYHLSRYEDALKHYENAIEIKADYVEAWKEKGDTLSRLNQNEAAMEAYDRAIQLNPQYLDAWIRRGDVLNRLQRYDGAIASFEKAIELVPESAEAWNGKGNTLLSSQRYEEAIAAYEQALEFQPESSEAWYARGWAFHQLKDYEAALKSYDKSVEYQFDYAVGWYNRGNVLMQLNQEKEAVESYDKAVRFHPSYAEAWYSRGNALMKSNDFSEAAKSYERAVKILASYQEAWYSLGWALHQLRRYEQAIEAYNQAIDLKKSDYRAWYNRGNALYNLNRYQEAVSSYNEAAYLKPDHAESWYGKGNGLSTLGQYQEAVLAYDRALRYQPNYRAAREGKERAQREIEQREKRDLAGEGERR
ncbi:tetratricopeptide repeat protein [Laspinema palackyanum]|uniref:tetratricopeptide repeat protein n=1 Tax=Laspinema palackyanum TaxID=3231601 RepID=UPI00349F06EA